MCPEYQVSFYSVTRVAVGGPPFSLLAGRCPGASPAFLTRRGPRAPPGEPVAVPGWSFSSWPAVGEPQPCEVGGVSPLIVRGTTHPFSAALHRRQALPAGNRRSHPAMSPDQDTVPPWRTVPSEGGRKQLRPSLKFAAFLFPLNLKITNSTANGQLTLENVRCHWESQCPPNQAPLRSGTQSHPCVCDPADPPPRVRPRRSSSRSPGS